MKKHSILATVLMSNLLILATCMNVFAVEQTSDSQLPVVINDHMATYAYDSLEEFVTLTPEQRFDTNHALWTFGDPYYIDLGANNINTTDNKYDLELKYDDSMFTSLGLTPDSAQNLAIYMYEPSIASYIYVGGNIDVENKCITTKIDKPGQYVLILNPLKVAAPVVKDETVSENSVDEETVSENSVENDTENIEQTPDEQIDNWEETEEYVEEPYEDTYDDTYEDDYYDSSEDNKPLAFNYDEPEEETEEAVEETTEDTDTEELTTEEKEIANGIGKLLSILSIISLIASIVMLVSLWKIFVKADEAGWKAIVPILNVITFSKISTGKPLLGLLMLIPGVNVIATIYMYYRFNKSFGGGIPSFIMLLIIPFVILPIMAFNSDVEYYGYDAIIEEDDEEE